METKTKYDCDTCQDDRVVEILGDGDHFECDVVGYKECPDCCFDREDLYPSNPHLS